MRGWRQENDGRQKTKNGWRETGGRRWTDGGWRDTGMRETGDNGIETERTESLRMRQWVKETVRRRRETVDGGGGGEQRVE